MFMIILSRFLALTVLAFMAYSNTANAAQTFVGDMEEYRTRSEDDTLIEIAHRENLGYVELRAANPSLDPWLPGDNRKVILPKRHLLPDAPQNDVVINLGEMRLYYYPGKGKPVQTYPLGIGREGLLTPLGTTTITRKRNKPTWSPTARMRKEDPSLPATVLSGPDNPMGVAAMYLGWPLYAIHGTNKPWGIGRRVSSGCIRMYNADIRKLYDQIPVGTKVTVVDQPVKTAWIDGRFYVEAHPNAEQADKIVNTYEDIDYSVSDGELSTIFKAAGAYKDQIDWKEVRKALRYRPGYPVAVSGQLSETSANNTAQEPQQKIVEKEPIKPAPVAVKKVEADDIQPSKKPWRKARTQTPANQYVDLLDVNG